MRLQPLLWISLTTLVLAGGTAPAAAAEYGYSVVSNDEIVGALNVRIAGATEVVDYRVSNNGRGPTIRESLRLENDLPVEYSAEGTTAFGGVVRERMTWSGKRLRWRSAADGGEVATDGPTLYAPNDGTPWATAVLVRALLAAPGQALALAPSGRAALDALGDLRIGDEDLRVYALRGVGLTPDLVFLDREQRLFALLEGGIVGNLVVRQGAERAFREILAAGKRLSYEQAARQQRALAHRYDAPVRIRNVRVFDPRTGRTSEPQSVVVFRGRIATVGADSGAPADAGTVVVVDGQGGTVVPGLHDMHAHNSVASGLFYLAAGVTNVRDNGNDNTELLELSARIDRGELPGPRIVRSGFLEGRSPYSARLGRIADSLPEALEAVRWYAAHGYRMIKIYNSLDPDWVKPVADEAHRLGLRVHGHVPAFMSPDRAIRDGYDEIAHLNQLALGWILRPGEDTRTPLRLTALGERGRTIDVSGASVRATLDLMKQHGTAIDTTAVILERLMMSRAGMVAEGDAAYLDHLPIGYQRYRKRSFVNFGSAGLDRYYRESFARLIDVMAALRREGIRMLPGTDDATGFTLHRELELYVRAGYTPGEALSLATLECHRYLGRDQEFGAIEPGKRADLVLLEADPTVDINAVRRVRMVVKDDAVYFPAEIYPALGIRPFATAPPVHSPDAARTAIPGTPAGTN